ncbi:MAG: ATP-binding protein [Lachnospiraceae bacterium]
MPEDKIKNYGTDYARWAKFFRRMGMILYLVTVFLEVGIYFVLRMQNMIKQSTQEYMWLYMIKPIMISTLIMVIGSYIIFRTRNDNVKKYTQILMITLMFGNVAYVHNVFMVALVIFSIPIFLTVVYQDQKMLNWVTLVSEVIVACIGVYSYVGKHGAGKNAYYIPSVLIVIVILLACRSIANISIRVLIEQNKALINAMEEAKRAQLLADKSNQSKTVFLSSMSHEIRTPINAVLGLDEMIIRESTEPEIRDYAMDIRSSGKALLGLVNDVLDFSKIESGKLDLVEVEYDVSSMINDLVNMISTRAQEKGLTLTLEIQQEIPHLLHGDEIRIKQIIMNLLTNAVKYTDRGEVKLCISYEKEDEDHIRLSVMVRDTGKGIKEEDLNRLFTPFERIDEKRNRNIEGTGLGMSIVKRLLGLMNSDIHVESVYGLGSDFSFTILQEVRDWQPIGNYEETYRRVKEKEMQYHEQFKAPDARILVTDDTPINLRIVQNLLKRTQVQIDVAMSGMECLRKASEKTYHVILIDHMMPEMDGIETLRHIKNDEDSMNRETPLIALSANAISGSREIYLNEGFAEYIMKPIDPVKLERTLMRFIPDELLQ